LSKGELLLATTNQGKLREAREILSDLPFDLLALSDCESIQQVAETGATFIENASLKARGYANQTHLLTLADDSGLEIETLNGAPGVRSARYLGEDVPYSVRNQSLLAELRNHENRAAQFVCSIAIAGSNGRVLNIATGVCEGRIAIQRRGTGGFGYDPIFIPNGFESTFGELPAQVKNRISHRARALAEAREFLSRLTDSYSAG
jgi:XTP/dITP diphosphohydrolase